MTPPCTAWAVWCLQWRTHACASQATATGHAWEGLPYLAATSLPALSARMHAWGRAGDERIDWLLHKKPLFHLHWKDGRVPLDVRNKIVVIRGDLHEPDLGLSAADRARIVSEVEYVIHSAASISFFEHIHTLLEQNYEVRAARFPALFCMRPVMPANWPLPSHPSPLALAGCLCPLPP